METSASLEQQKFKRDLIYSYASLFILAISGLFINLIISLAYKPSTLGRFNIIFAFYIVLAQLATSGINSSVLYYISRATQDVHKRNEIICSGILISIFIGVIVSISLFLCHGIIGRLFHNSLIGSGIVFICPAIIFFSMNKILLAALNGLREMRLYAICQSVRYVLMITFIACVCVSGGNEVILNANYIFSELILFFVLIYFVFIKQGIKKPVVSLEHSLMHLKFGTKGFLSGVLMEINSRVDILILGLFVDNRIVGIYSFAALFSEGLGQFTAILKNNINPMLAKFIYSLAWDDLYALIRKTRRFNVLLVGALSMVLLLAYPIMIHILSLNKAYLSPGWFILAILVCGVFVSSAVLPYDNIFVQSNKPMIQTFYGFTIVFSNVILSFLLVKEFAYLGCAFAVIISTYILPIFTASFLAKRFLGVNLIRF